MSKTIEEHQAALLHEMTSWSSLRLQVLYNQTLHVPIASSKVGDSLLSHEYIETSVGQRYFDVRFVRDDGSVSRTAGYSDGQRFARVDYHREREPVRAESIGLSTSFLGEATEGYTQRPMPSQWMYVGLKPLYEALKEARFVGQLQVLGRPCDVFRFTVPGPRRTQDLLYWLDQQTSIPLKIEAFPEGEGPDAAQPFWRWEAHSLDMVQGYHIPLRSTNTNFMEQDGRATDRLLLTIRVEVQSVEFNKEYPASIFWPTFTPGAQVIDAVGKGGIYTVPDPNPPPPAGTIAAPALEATPDRGWSDALPITATVFGLLLIVVALSLWWRRR